MAKLEWQQLWDAMDADPSAWIETTCAMYWHMLECVPPRAQTMNTFLVGEAKCHDANGDAVYACFKRIGEKFFAKHMTIGQYDRGPV